jgi:hypothetical protein
MFPTLSGRLSETLQLCPAPNLQLGIFAPAEEPADPNCYLIEPARMRDNVQRSSPGARASMSSIRQRPDSRVYL